MVTKARVNASQVFDKFTVATMAKSLDSSIYNRLFSISEEKEVAVRKEDIQPWKATSDSPIKVGDEVQVEIEDGEAKALPAADKQSEKSAS
jgi:hypothetical protein